MGGDFDPIAYGLIVYLYIYMQQRAILVAWVEFVSGRCKFQVNDRSKCSETQRSHRIFGKPIIKLDRIRVGFNYSTALDDCRYLEEPFHHFHCHTH